MRNIDTARSINSAHDACMTLHDTLPREASCAKPQVNTLKNEGMTRMTPQRGHIRPFTRARMIPRHTEKASYVSYVSYASPPKPHLGGVEAHHQGAHQ